MCSIPKNTFKVTHLEVHNIKRHIYNCQFCMAFKNRKKKKKKRKTNDIVIIHRLSIIYPLKST